MASQAPVTSPDSRPLTGYTLPTRSGGDVERDPHAWERSALCAQVDGDLWFPDKGGSTREAKAICSRCPVAVECLEAALTDPGDFYGIRGGVSVKERIKIRKDRGIQLPKNQTHGLPRRSPTERPAS